MDDPTSPPTPTRPDPQGSQGPAGARTSDPQPTPTSQGPAGAPTPTSPDPRGPAGALTPPTPGSQGPAGAPTPDPQPTPTSQAPAGAPTHPDARRSRLGTVVAVAVALTGAVWLLQGLGVLTAGDSFMTGDPRWAVVGVVFIVGGVLLGARTRRRAAPTS